MNNLSRKLNSTSKKPLGPVNVFTRFINKNPKTSLTPVQTYPKISKTAFLSPYTSVVGNVTLSKNVFVDQHAAILADRGGPIFVGANTSIVTGAVLNGERKRTIGNKSYSIIIGKKTVISTGALVNGASIVGDGVVVGGNVYNSIIGDGCFIGANSTVRRVTIAPNRFVPHGAVVVTQKQADSLRKVPSDFIALYKELYATYQTLRAGYSRMYG
ncbi:hypothetical protein [Paenibacillus herberti]|uniref:Carbonate dehydratase n=1 Tax=Paenibacillus herberti TaxID=1619309 RepID=A0A229NUT7_9BACL|nr:hypothetical protein [Paenibacillus herberti]OXM13590.1 carbonate dehydratase [Paenibacillus herberti]